MRRLAFLSLLVACGGEPAAPRLSEVEPPIATEPAPIEPSLPDPAPTPAPPAPTSPTRCGPIERAGLDEDAELFAVPLPGAEPRDADPPESAGPSWGRARRCAEGCVLFGPDGSIAVSTFGGVEESGFPLEVRIARFDPAGTRTDTTVRIGDDDAEALYAWQEEGADPPWTGAVSRALRGTADWTVSADAATGRASSEFSLAMVSSVRGIAAPLADWLLFAELGPDSVLLQLVRRDCASSRVVGSLPLTAGACDGDATNDLCIVPPSIEHLHVTPDGHVGVAVLDVVAAGHGGLERRVVRLALDGVAPSPAVPSADLVASMNAPGRRPRWLGALSWRDEEDDPHAGPEPLVGGAPTSRCDWECTFFGAATVTVRPDIVLGDGAPDALVVTRDGAETRVAIPGDPDTDGDEMAWHERTVAALGALDGLVPARDLVSREAIANDHGQLVTPLVELAAPLEGALLFVETTDVGYALRMRTETALSTLGAPAPLLRRDGEIARAGIARVYVSPDGSRLVALLYARTGERRTELFHVAADLRG